MSEFQYYEVQAVDRPLTKADQETLRGLSTRARITATSFTNHYEWGDFKGDLRLFYLLWLSAVADDLLTDDTPEPLPGIGKSGQRK